MKKLSAHSSFEVEVDKWLELAQLTHKKRAYPEELSGGEQQRVALLRALAPRPQMLLMDEPFSALDSHLRVTLRRQVKQLLRRFEMTALLVTHSRQEAFELGDRVSVWDHQFHYQTGSPQDLIFNPQTSSLVEFMNSGVLLEGKYAQSSQTVLRGKAQFKIVNFGDFRDGQRVYLFVPFELLNLRETGPCLGQGKVLSSYPCGEQNICVLEGEEGLKPQSFEMRTPSPLGSAYGEGQWVNFYLKKTTPLKAIASL